MIGCKSCMTIVAVIYGYTPKATIENVCKDPPEKTSSSPSNCPRLLPPLVEKSFVRLACSADVKGTVIWARMRKISNIPNVKRILLRRSGIVQILRSRSHMRASFYEGTYSTRKDTGRLTPRCPD